MNLTAKLTPYSSVVGGGLQIVDEKGRARFIVALMGTTDGISKEQNDELSKRLADGFNAPQPDAAPADEKKKSDITDKPHLKTILCVLCSAKEGQSWSAPMLKDLDIAIECAQYLMAQPASPLPADDVIERAVAIAKSVREPYGLTSERKVVEALAAANFLRQSAPVEETKTPAKVEAAAYIDYLQNEIQKRGGQIDDESGQVDWPAYPPADVAAMREKIAEAAFEASQFRDDEDVAPSWKILQSRITDETLGRETILELTASRDHFYKIADAILALSPTDAAVKALVEELKSLLSECEDDFHVCQRCGSQDDTATRTSNLFLLLKDKIEEHTTLAQHGVK